MRAAGGSQRAAAPQDAGTASRPSTIPNVAGPPRHVRRWAEWPWRRSRCRRFHLVPSCIWLLEQLWRFESRPTTRTEVDLQRPRCGARRVPHGQRERRCDTSPQGSWLRSVTRPVLTAETAAGDAPVQRLAPPAICQLGIAGFAFGNAMLFSIPRYAERRAARGRVPDAVRRAESRAGPCRCWSIARRTSSARPGSGASPHDEPGCPDRNRTGCALRADRRRDRIGPRRGLHRFVHRPGLLPPRGRLFQQKAFDRIAFDRSFRSFLPLAVRVEAATAMRWFRCRWSTLRFATGYSCAPAILSRRMRR